MLSKKVTLSLITVTDETEVTVAGLAHLIGKLEAAFSSMHFHCGYTGINVLDIEICEGDDEEGLTGGTWEVVTVVSFVEDGVRKTGAWPWRIDWRTGELEENC